MEFKSITEAQQLKIVALSELVKDKTLPDGSTVNVNKSDLEVAALAKSSEDYENIAEAQKIKILALEQIVASLEATKQSLEKSPPVESVQRVPESHHFASDVSDSSDDIAHKDDAELRPEDLFDDMDDVPAFWRE